VHKAYPVPSHEVVLEGPADYPDLFVDRHGLQQIVLNVIGNAAKFTPAGGRVLVTVAVPGQTGDGLEITVTDTGIGIPASALPVLGRAFEQVEKGLNRKHGGSGLGLYITRMLMERHGGKLEISSEEEVGTIVRLSFPADALMRDAVPALGAARAG
jgi:two-component system, cell cycle sensor histidine kinase PleC